MTVFARAMCCGAFWQRQAWHVCNQIARAGTLLRRLTALVGRHHGDRSPGARTLLGFGLFFFRIFLVNKHRNSLGCASCVDENRAYHYATPWVTTQHLFFLL